MLDWVGDLARSIAVYRLVANYSGVLLLLMSGAGLVGMVWKHRDAHDAFSLWSVASLVAVLALAGIAVLGALVLLEIVAPG